MPIFEYQCDRCKTKFEKLVFATDQTQIQCPECKSATVSKQMSATGFTGRPTCISGGLPSGLPSGCPVDQPEAAAPFHEQADVCAGRRIGK